MTRRLLRGYKEIARILGSEWGVDVSVQSVWRWARRSQNPLPVRRIRTGDRNTKAIVAADELEVRRWAKRRMAA